MIAKKLLVVVDYQRDFVDGTLGFEAAKLLEDPICERVSEYYANGGDVVFTMDTHEQKYLLTNEGKHLPVKHCIKGTPGWELYGKLCRLAREEKMLRKPTFASMELARYIQENGPFSTIELCGVVSNICVVSNAVIAKAASPESEIIINKRLIASPDEEMENKALDLLENLHTTVIGRD